jgi:hypothetical protein
MMVVTGNKNAEQGRQKRIWLSLLYYLLVSWAAVVVVEATKETPPSSCFESLYTPSRQRLVDAAAKTTTRKSRTSTTESTVEQRLNIRLQNDWDDCFESVCAVRGGATTDEANTAAAVAPLSTIDDSASLTTVGGDTMTTVEVNETDSTESTTLGDLDVTNNVDDETTTTTTTTTTSVIVPPDLDEIRELATQLRLQGREFHDQADFAQAASFFQKAADMLLPVLVGLEAGLPGDSETQEMLDEFSTCRLHEALCRLKGNEYEKCIAACTNFLDGAGGQLSTTSSSSSSSARVVRARAYHRRAKAKLGLQDTSGALEDARSAAFLGDRKAVALYGRLMRESSSSYGGSASVDAMSATLERMLSSSSSLGSGSSASSSSSLFESLLSKSGSSSSSSSSPGASSLFGDFSPAAMLLGKNPLDFLTGGKDGAAGGGGGKLAKSVLQSLSKRLEEESTQDTICGYLHGTNKAQLTQLAAMAGAGDTLSGKQIDKVVDFCHGVTPKTIRTTVRTTKGVIYVVQIFRRILKILTKYKSLIAAIIFLQWTKSAVLRPLPINKAAAKRALKEAMKANRPTKPKKK